MKRLLIALTMAICSLSLLTKSDGYQIALPQVFMSDKLSLQQNILILANQLRKCNVFHRDVVIAQALIETGYFKSELFRRGNNLFGMKMPNNRPTLAFGTIKVGSFYYAYYKNTLQCITDYALWQSNIINYERKVNKHKYLLFIGKRYSENHTYTAMIKYVIKKYHLNNY